MFPTAQPPRAEEDTATIEQVIEQVPGELELYRIIKAQSSGPQIAKRMVELGNSIWSLVGALLLLPDARLYDKPELGKMLGKFLVNAASATGFCNTIQCIDPTLVPSKQDPFGCIR